VSWLNNHNSPFSKKNNVEFLSSINEAPEIVDPKSNTSSVECSLEI